MPRPGAPRLAILLTLAAGIVAALFVGRWYLTQGRFPLRGELRHDFGVIPITGPGGARSHTFQLTNKTGDPLVIESVRSSCGCTTVDLQNTTVEPGATLDLPVTLSLTNSARKRSNIKLLIRDFGVQTLFIEGIGRRDPPLQVTDSWPGLPMPLAIFVEVEDSNTPPPIPELRASDGITATFSKWSLRSRRNRLEAKPAIWRGQIKFDITGAAPPDDPHLTIIYDDTHELHLPLKPRSFVSPRPIAPTAAPPGAGASTPTMAPGRPPVSPPNSDER